MYISWDIIYSSYMFLEWVRIAVALLLFWSTVTFVTSIDLILLYYSNGCLQSYVIYIFQSYESIYSSLSSSDNLRASFSIRSILQSTISDINPLSCSLFILSLEKIKKYIPIERHLIHTTRFLSAVINEHKGFECFGSIVIMNTIYSAVIKQ